MCRVGAALGWLPPWRPNLDMDRSVLLHQAAACQSKQTADILCLGDSSCLMDVAPRILERGLSTGHRVLNGGTISYLDLTSAADLLRQYLATNPGRLRYLVVLLHPESLRRRIGFVPQETFLFSTTLGENIAFGVKGADTEQIARAAEIAGLSPDVEGFPQGYETMVGERGITLSGGQKQRAAIARAILRDPEILILDDALSSVDTVTEERILRSLKTVFEGRTTILISHRVSTLRHADRIYVLEGGRVVEQGTHDELTGRGGYYADLHRKQLLEEELEGHDRRFRIPVRDGRSSRVR